MIAYLALSVTTPLIASLSSLLTNRRPIQAPHLPRQTPATWTPFDLLTVVVLIVFSGIRLNVGTDYGLYNSIFSRHTRMSLGDAMGESPQELGYTFLSWTIAQLTDSVSFLFLAAAILTVIPFYAGIKHFSPNPSLSILLYILLGFYLVPLNIIRQGIALALNFYSLRYLNKDLRKFIALNAIAATFHVSVIPAAALQIACRKLVPSWRLLFIACCISILLLLALSVSDFLQGLAGTLNPRYETYLPSATDADGGSLGTYLLLVTRILIAAYSLWLPVPGNLRFLQVLLVLAIPLQASALAAPPVARLELYFSAAAVVLLVAQVKLSTNKSLHATIIGVAGFSYLIMYLMFFGGLIPYRTIWWNPN